MLLGKKINKVARHLWITIILSLAVEILWFSHIFKKNGGVKKNLGLQKKKKNNSPTQKYQHFLSQNHILALLYQLFPCLLFQGNLTLSQMQPLPQAKDVSCQNKYFCLKTDGIFCMEACSLLGKVLYCDQYPLNTIQKMEPLGIS